MVEAKPERIDLSAANETARLQNLASAPGRSAWVSANAGSGKTHVLTQRVIRLMLAGARPSSILCLTYTKAAASEMSNRVFERLSRWTSLDDETLAAEIAAMEGASPDIFKLAEARRLFARALETPGGLKIQTIHAFCEALLHQFPLEANVAGHFNVLDDLAQKSLLSEARRALLTASQAEANPSLAAAFHDVLTIGDESGLNRLLDDIIARRTSIGAFLAHAKTHGGIETLLRQALDIDADTTVESLAARAWPLPGVSPERLAAYIDLANAKGGSKVHETSYRLGEARNQDDPVKRLKLLREAFLKKTDESPFGDSSIFSAAMVKADPALCTLIGDARFLVSDLWQAYKTFGMFSATLSALTMAERLIAGYEGLKRERAFLDFEDFILKTQALLAKDDIGPWVHYKLDQGIDHILVDEAQDTSPLQWDIIRSLAEEFFSGDSARPLLRTLFAVGDEKQSIYSFQGARPERFALERERMGSRAEDAGLPFESLNLRISFRSTDEVLSAVDQVFSEPANARGLSASGEPILHVSNRFGQPGAVDIWDMIADETGNEEDEDWLAPFDRLPERSSASELARRMAAYIGDLVGKQAIMTRNGPRLITAGDVLVLVRKRDAFAGALAKELKKSGDVPVAGTDRLVLASHIAIQDLMALGRFVTLADDDLSLAALFKSPLLSLGEDDLFALAAERLAGESLWHSAQRRAGERQAWTDAVHRLSGLRALADRCRVYEFYAHVLSAAGGRKQFLARFGHEVSDVLDEFLNFALAHEQSALPGLTGFIATLESDSPEIKREQDKGRDEVRIMTVHASKGLEAPVVFLVDGGSKPFDKTLLPKMRLLADRDPGVDVPVWAPGKDFQNPLTAADDLKLEKAAEEEYRRLLYVGMTRASDRLVLCGYRKKREHEDTWARLVTGALSTVAGQSERWQFRAGGLEWEGYRWRQADRAALAAPAATAEQQRSLQPAPAELFAPLPPAKFLPRPLAPSGAHAFVDETEGDLIVGSSLFGEKSRGSSARLRGKLTHRLLQTLPDLEPDERTAAAQRYLERAVPAWTEAARAALADSVLNLIDDTRFAGLFAAGARSEVSIMGTVRLGARDFAVSGRIDRMGQTGDRVFIVDYKTNRVAPQDRNDIPLAHRAQLALYREVLKPLYPGQTIACLLLYTEGPDLYFLNDAEVEKALLDISPE